MTICSRLAAKIRWHGPVVNESPQKAEISGDFKMLCWFVQSRLKKQILNLGSPLWNTAFARMESAWLFRKWQNLKLFLRLSCIKSSKSFTVQVCYGPNFTKTDEFTTFVQATVNPVVPSCYLILRSSFYPPWSPLCPKHCSYASNVYHPNGSSPVCNWRIVSYFSCYQGTPILSQVVSCVKKTIE